MYTTREGEMSEMGDPEWLVQFKSILDNQLFSTGQSPDQVQQQQQLGNSLGHSLGQSQLHQQQEQQIYEDGEGRRYFFDVNTNQWCLIQEQQGFGTSSENITQPLAAENNNKEEVDEPITMSTPSTAPPTPSMISAAVPPSYPPTTTVPAHSELTYCAYNRHQKSPSPFWEFLLCQEAELI